MKIIYLINTRKLHEKLRKVVQHEHYINYRNKTIENKFKSQIICRLHRNTIINLQNKNLREFSHRLAQPTKHRKQKCLLDFGG